MTQGYLHESNAGDMRIRGHLLVMVSVLMLVMLAFILVAPADAHAVTVDTTTAKSNDQGSNDIFGGIPTRLTWETVVDEGEDMRSLSLALPAGSDTSSSTVTLTVLEGLDRIDVGANTTFGEDVLDIDFDTPIAAGQRLRVEIHGIALPVGVETVTVGGTYTLSSGEVRDLPSSPEIHLVDPSTTKRITDWLDNQPWVEKWNSVSILRTFLRPQLIVTSVPTLFFGWLRALSLVFLGFPLAIPLGLILAMLKMHRGKGNRIPSLPAALSSIVNFIRRFLGWLANLYINVIRGTPLFLQIYIAVFGLPLLGLNFDKYPVAVAVLAMNSSAYLAEIFRAGIQSINKGQFEAAASLGMNGFQTMFFVIIPQTVRRVIPTMTSEFILLYKDTSLLSAVGVMELMMFSKSLTANTGNMTPYIVAALYYLVVTLPLIKVVNILERKLAGADGSAPQASRARLSRRERREARRNAEATGPTAYLADNAGDAPVDPIMSSPSGHSSN